MMTATPARFVRVPLLLLLCLPSPSFAEHGTLRVDVGDQAHVRTWLRQEPPVISFDVKPIRIRGDALGDKDKSSRRNESSAEQSSASVVIEKCFQSFMLPDEGSGVCPSQCPLLRVDVDALCHYKCVDENSCLYAPHVPTSFADHDMGICRMCREPGCAKCSTESADKCMECQDWMDLVEGGQCLPKSRKAWHVVYVIVATGALCAMTYVLVLACRRVVNQKITDQALDYRSHSKPRADQDGHPLWPIGTNLSAEFVSGTGIMMHFRFQHVVLCWAIFCCGCVAAVALYHERLHAKDVLAQTPHTERGYQSCMELSDHEHNRLEDIQHHLCYATGVIYVVSTIGAFIFAKSQRRLHAKTQFELSEMSDFALMAEGFPIEGGGDLDSGCLEWEYASYFKGLLGAEAVVGVTICYDLHGERYDDVMESALRSVTKPLDLPNHGNDNDEDSVAATESGDEFAEEEKPKKKRSCCDTRMRCLDGFLGVGAPCSAEDPEGTDKEVDGEKVEEMLKTLKTTGSCFVIMNTEADMLRVLEGGMPGKFRDQHPINLTHMEVDAVNILWDGFAYTNRDRWIRALTGIAILLGVIFVWTVFFYGPYAWYIHSWSSVGGMSQGSPIDGLFVGLLITVGNQVVYYTCGAVATYVKFKTGDDRDTFDTVLYTFAVFLNTVMDMCLVVYMSYAYQQDTLVDPEAIIQNPNLQQAMYIQLLLYLFPGTLLIPFLLEPIVASVLPFYLTLWLVRSRKVCLQDAEGMLMAPPFDMKRYGDILINAMLVILCFFLSSISIWWVFAMLAISCAVILTWDHYRFLRETCRTHFSSKRMDVVAQYLTAMPCAMLAAAFAFKWMGGVLMVSDWEKHSFFNHTYVWGICAMAFLVHLIFHLLVVHFVIPLRRTNSASGTPGSARTSCDNSDSTVPYEDTARVTACSWFTANPVHCLRSAHVFGDSPPFVFYQSGKEYLQKRNDDICAYYESTKYDEEKSLAQESSRLMHVGASWVKDHARSPFHSRGVSADATEPENTALNASAGGTMGSSVA